MIFTKSLLVLTALLSASLVDASAANRRAEVAARNVDSMGAVQGPRFSDALAGTNEERSNAAVKEDEYNLLTSYMEALKHDGDSLEQQHIYDQGVYVEKLVAVVHQYAPDANAFVYHINGDQFQMSLPPVSVKKKFKYWNLPWVEEYEVVLFFGGGSVTNNGDGGWQNWGVTGNYYKASGRNSYYFS